MSDLISRQAAIDALYHVDEYNGRSVEAIRNLPSAQPECEDAVPRTSVEYICRKNTVSTNPYEHKHHDKFIQFMDDPEISDFGRWQHSNGFNTALIAVKCDLDKVPSVTPIEKLPSAQRWIPCEEQLPEPGVSVLVDVADIPSGGRFPLIDEICKDGEWLNCDGSEWLALAWMPIPDPWEGKNDG